MRHHPDRNAGRGLTALVFFCLFNIQNALGDSVLQTRIASLSPDIDRYLEPYVAGNNFSGTILVAEGDAIYINKGYGMAVQEHAVPNTADTRFQIGSISKTFTAAATLLLAEEGRVGLDDRLSTFIPDFPDGDLITIRHLLSHTSGIPRFVFRSDYRTASRSPMSTRELIDWFRNAPLQNEPGGQYSYSNANYALLAFIVEEVSGQSFGEFIDAEFLGPLGLEDTGDRSDGRSIVKNMATGYSPVSIDGISRSAYLDYSIYKGSGSLYTNTSDLLAWLRANIDGRLAGVSLNEPSFTWTHETALNRAAISASGWDGAGFGASLLHFIDDDITIIVLGNLNMSAIARHVADNVASLIFAEDTAFIEPAATTIHTTDELGSMAGLYQFGSDFYVPNTTIRIAVSGGNLIIPANDFAPEGGLLPLDGQRFLHRQQWIEIDFVGSSSDDISGMRYGPFVATRAD
jgi:CubicO group peptidase (beta-lactamase class C family)